MSKRDTVIPLDKLFSKWIIRDKWENKTPDFFADTMINLRIRNGGVTPRNWKKTIYLWANGSWVQGITWNQTTGKLLCVWDEHLYSINLSNDPVDVTDIWDIWYSGSVNMVNYGKYTLILTGSGYPRVYDNSTLSQLTSSNIPANTNPSFGMRYAWFTIVNSNLDKNIIHISRPITQANQERCYDFVWSWAETRTFDSAVSWMISTLQYLRIFTATTIEYISRDTLTTVWWTASLFSVPIASWDILLNSRMVASANEYIFYFTKSRKIKTINYIQWNPVPQVAIISEEIEEFLDNELSDDQSSSFSYYDRENNEVKFFVKSVHWASNDICIARSLNTSSCYIYTSKWYSCMADIDEKQYAGSPFIFRITQDEVTKDDDWAPISWKYLSAKGTIWDPVAQKRFRGNKIAWKLNEETEIFWSFIVDGKTIMWRKHINWSIIHWNWQGNLLWIWSAEIWWEAIGWSNESIVTWLKDFSEQADVWAIRASWQYFQILLEWSKRWQDFIIDYTDITIRPQVRSDIRNKV